MRELSASGSGSQQPIPDELRGRRRLTTMAMAVGMGLLLSVLVFILIIVLITRVFFQNQIGSPSQVAQQYYAALHEGDLTLAYNYFSPSARAKFTYSAFETQEQGFEAVEGIIETYTTVSTTITGNTAVVQEQITRKGSDAPETDTLNMEQDNGTWYIASIVIPAPTK